MVQNMRGNQRTIGWFSSLTWVLGMERRLSSLGASACMHWAISLAPKRKFWMEEAGSGNFLTMEFKATEVFLYPASLFMDSQLGVMDWVQPFGILDLVSLLLLSCLWISYFFPFISPYSIACKCFQIAQKIPFKPSPVFSEASDSCLSPNPFYSNPFLHSQQVHYLRW